MESTIEAIVARRYTTEDRLTLDVTVHLDGRVVARTWALNEASVEKAARERMIEVVVEVDGRPLSRWGCDGVVRDPTGSTAYNFSAGGPVVWPGVEALLMVRSARTRCSPARSSWRPPRCWPWRCWPVPTGPGSCGPTVAGPWTCLRALGSRSGAAARRCAWCGCTRHRSPIALVAKFGLPVEGWRGANVRRRRPTDPGPGSPGA